MENFPDEICLQILKYFPPRRLITELSFVCKRWRKLALSPSLWHNVELNIDDLADCQAELHSFLSQIAVGPRRLSLSTRESVRPAIFSILPRLPNLVWLNFAFVDGLDTSVVEFLVENCPSVAEANFEGCKELNDASLTVIGEGWRNLRRLNISHCRLVTDSGLNSLFNSANHLESININEVQSVSNATVDLLARKHGDSLQSVWLDGDWLSDLAILSLSQNCTRLREICISAAIRLTDRSFEYLKRLDGICHLHITLGWRLRWPGLSDMSVRQFAQLQFLSLHDWRGITDVGVDMLTISSPLLKTLCLSRCESVSNSGVDLIVMRCRNLKILSLVGMHINGSAFNSVPQANLPQLKFLNLSQCDMVVNEVIDDLLIRSDQLVVVKSNGETFKGVRDEVVPLSYLVTKNLLKSLDGHYCPTTGF